MKYFNKIILVLLWLEVLPFHSRKKVDAKAKTILETVSKIIKPRKYLLQVFLRNGNWKKAKLKPGIFYSTPTQYKLNIMGNEQILTEKSVQHF